MPRYVFNLVVGDEKYVIDHHGMEIDTLHEVHTNPLRVLHQPAVRIMHWPSFGDR